MDVVYTAWKAFHRTPWHKWICFMFWKTWFVALLHSLIVALTDCCIYWLLYLLTVALTDCFTHWLLQPLTVALTDCCTYWLLHSLTVALTDCCTHWLLHLLTVALTDCCTHWLLHLLTVALTDCSTYWLLHLLTVALMLRLFECAAESIEFSLCIKTYCEITHGSGSDRIGTSKTACWPRRQKSVK
jgi:hypothetical protein